MINSLGRALAIACFILMGSTVQAADLAFSRHYSDNMVLQRGKPALIRGFADKGSKVTVTFGDRKQDATANDKGEWSVILDPMKANANGQKLTVHSTLDTSRRDPDSSGRSSTLDNVVVGDVFLFARQTTIDVSLGRDAAGKKAASDIPSARVILIKTIPSDTPQHDLAEEATSGWGNLGKATALKMNATAFYVAKDLAKDAGVPIGIVDLNLGYHFPIAWLSNDALKQTATIFGDKADRVSGMTKHMEKKVATFNDDELREKMNKKNGYPLQHPRIDARFPSAGYNAVLHPMRGLSLKGLVLQLGNDYFYYLNEWLVREGKHTSRPHLGQAYEDTYDIRKWGIYLEPNTVSRLPREWRKVFGDMSLPVGWITPPGSDLITMGRHHREIRELQRQTAEKEKGVSLILAGTDHIPFSAQPADEALLADRCLAWVKGAVYNQEGVVPTGPVFDRVEIDYSKAQVFFKPGTAKGLKVGPGALDQFEVAGVEMEYSPAKATIDGETIRLSSDTVNQIAYVRYNWKGKPNQGLTSANGMPVIPFNTDGHTYPKTIGMLGEEVLPPEFSTAISEWKSDGPVIFNGKLNLNTNGGKYLGPTGLRVSLFGPNLFVNNAYVGSPADGKILHGDYIYAVNGKTFGKDIFGEVAEAITQAEAESGKGLISFDLVRKGKKMTVELKLEVLGTYSSTAPYNCPKTDRIVVNAEKFLAKYGGVVPGHPVFTGIDAMFLLAAGSPEYQGLVRRHIYNRMTKRDITKPIDPTGKGAQGGGWDLSADIFLAAEYYLATGDRNVLPHLRYWCDTMTSVQIRGLEEEGPWPQVQRGQAGGWRHNFFGGATYGTLPTIQVPATLGYHLTKEAGVTYNFLGYQRALNWFLHNGAKIGSVGYGYHAKPQTVGNNIDPAQLAVGKLLPGNGGVGGAALVFHLQGNGPVARTCSFIATHCYDNTWYSHGGHFWVNVYTPLGALVHGKESFKYYMKKNRNYQELHRMHDHSRQQDRVFGAGQFLAYVAPRKRLRILGAHKSVFGVNPPGALKSALAAYYDRDYAASEKVVNAVLDQGDLIGLDLLKAQQLQKAAIMVQKSIALDVARVKKLIAEGKSYEASLDVTQLKAVMPEGNAELVAIEKQLNDPVLTDAIKQDQRRYGAYVKSLVLKIPEAKGENEGGEWKPLVINVKLGRGLQPAKEQPVPPTTWRKKVVESLAVAPKGWTEPDFDDSKWSKTYLPISWHTNHTAVMRAPFEIDDPSKVKSLRLIQYAYRNDEIQVFINGKVVAKVSETGSGTKVTIVLNENALKALKKGKNVLAATYKNNWRWGRYFKGANSVYEAGVRLSLEMREQ